RSGRPSPRHRRAKTPYPRRTRGVPHPSSITDVRVEAHDADDVGSLGRHTGVVRELAAAALVLLALAVGALAPKFWPMDSGSALASGRPASSGPLATVASATFAPVSWKGKDGGMGYVVCGSTQNWSRPTISEQNAHLASDARYARMRADDPGSEAWTKFQVVALLYDGSALSGRIDLVALTGMWTDPYIGGNAAGCTSVEPQVWLVGYEPVSFRGSPGISQIGVRQASGYRMVVLTGAIGTDLIIVGPGGKMAAFDTRPWRRPTPTPAPKALPTSKTAASPEPPFPMTDRPLELALPGCAISPQGRHADRLRAPDRLRLERRPGGIHQRRRLRAGVRVRGPPRAGDSRGVPSCAARPGLAGG